jgi:putative MATE family efflux protein
MPISGQTPEADAPAASSPASEAAVAHRDAKWSLHIDRELARRILTLAVPVIFAMATQTLINIVDEIMVNHLSGDDGRVGQAAGAALGLAVPVLWLMGGFVAAVSVGTQALTARRFGEQDDLAAGKVLTNSLVLALLAGGTMALIAFFFAEPIFRMLHDNPLVVRFGTEYMQLRALSIIGWVATFSYKSFFDGLGKTHVHLVAAIVMAIVNITLNFFLIYGLGPFPRLEVVGAGIGSTVGTFTGCFVMIAWSLRRRHRDRFHYYRLSNVDGATLWGIGRLSLPAGVASVAVMSGFLILLAIAARLDTQTSAENANATQVIVAIIEGVVFIPCLAFGTATATLVSQNLGAKEFALAKRYGYESVKIGTLIFGTMGLLLFAIPSYVMRIFTPNAMTIATGETALRMMGAFVLTIPSALIFPQALLGAGNTKFVMMVEVLLHFGLLVPLAFIFGNVLGWGLIGVWLAVGLYLTLLAVVMGWKFREGKWQSIQI